MWGSLAGCTTRSMETKVPRCGLPINASDAEVYQFAPGAAILQMSNISHSHAPGQLAHQARWVGAWRQSHARDALHHAPPEQNQYDAGCIC